MKPRLLAALAVSCTGLAFVVALWLAPRANEAELPRPGVTSAEEEPAPTRQELAPPPLSAAAALESVEADDAQRTPLVPETVEAPFEPSLPEGEGVLVHTVTEDGRPLPAADVWWLSEDRIESSQARKAKTLGVDFAQLAQTEGRHFRSDSSGHVRLPHEGEKVLLVGRTAERFGFTTLSGPPPVTLALPLDPVYDVTVTDGDGRGLEGVTCELEFLERARAFDVARCVTTANGRAAFRSVWSLLSQAADEGTFRIAVGGLFVTPRRAPLDVTEPRSQSFVFRLDEALGALALTVNPNELPVDGAVAYARWSRDDPAAQADLLQETFVPLCELGGERTSVFPVEVGLRVEFSVRSFSGSELASVTCAGPRAAGETVEVAFELATVPRVRARLVDETGRALATRDVQVALEGSSFQARCTTDAEGFFELELFERVGGRLDLRIEPSAQGAVRSGPLFGRVELPDELARGPNELGDVVLAQTRLLVAGHVVSTSGAPVVAARVQTRAVVPADEQRSPADDDSGTTLTGADGGFAVYGHPRRASVRVAAHAEGCSVVAHEVAVGTEDLRLELSPCGALRVQVVGLPAAVAATGRASNGSRARIEVWVAALGSEEQRRADLPRDAGARFEGLAPGIYRTSLWIPTAPGVGASLAADVEVPSGSTVEHVFDVTGALVVRTVSVLDADANPLSATVRVLGGDSAQAVAQRADRNGQVELLIPDEPLDLEVSHPGLRTTLLRDVRADETVVLLPGFPVRIAAPAELVLPAGVELMVLLLPDVEGPRGSPASGGALRPGATLELLAPAPGAYRLHLRLAGGAGASPPWRAALEVREGPVPVLLQGDEPVFVRLDVTQAEVDAALAANGR